MAKTQFGRTDRVIRWTTIFSVIVLAVIAAIVSYKHMYLLVRRYGETSWTAALLPISVDGMIAASSMSLLMDSRHGRRSGLLPWTLLIIGSAASLAANVAVAEPSVVGRLIAGWPSCALIGSYELLMRQIRHTNTCETMPESIHSDMHRATSGAAPEEPHTSPTMASYAPLARSAASRNGSEKSLTDSSFNLIGPSDEREEGAAGPTRAPRPSNRTHNRSDAQIQRQAWEWAVANRTPDGDLPSGKAIASEFGRSERWGRLVKQAGLAGRLNEAAA